MECFQHVGFCVCSTGYQACICYHAGAAANGVSKKQKPASRLQPAVQGDRASARHGALAGSSSSQLPAVNGLSTALVIHPSSAQPGRQIRAARAAAHGPVGNALALAPSRHAAVLREQAQVAENLPNLFVEAEEYKVHSYSQRPLQTTNQKKEELNL